MAAIPCLTRALLTLSRTRQAAANSFFSSLVMPSGPHDAQFSSAHSTSENASSSPSISYHGSTSFFSRLGAIDLTLLVLMISHHSMEPARCNQLHATRRFKFVHQAAFFVWRVVFFMRFALAAAFSREVSATLRAVFLALAAGGAGGASDSS